MIMNLTLKYVSGKKWKYLQSNISKCHASSMPLLSAQNFQDMPDAVWNPEAIITMFLSSLGLILTNTCSSEFLHLLPFLMMLFSVDDFKHRWIFPVTI